MNQDGYNPDTFLDFSQYTSSSQASNPSTYMDSGMNSPFFTPNVGMPQWFHEPPLMFSTAAGAVIPPQTPPFMRLSGPLPIQNDSNTPRLHQTFKSSPPSTPSPPSASTQSPTHHSQSSTPSPPQGSSGPSAKRKRTTKEDLMKVNAGIQWEDYLPPDTPVMQLLDNLVAIEPFGIQVGHIDKNAIVEPHKCIIYRQNQFKLQCTLSGSLRNYSTPHGHPTPNFLGSLDGRLYEIDGLYLKMYAFKQNADETTEEFKVPIHQVGPSRTKKETKPPEVMTIANGGGFFDKLQFQASTHVGSESYFRIVVTVVAKVQEKYYVVGGKISPKLLVRAQNPGRYNPNNPANQKNNPPPTPSTTVWHNNSPPSDQSEEYDENAPPTPSPPPAQLHDYTSAKPSWIQNNDVLYYYGRVGVNTENPQEALSVNGNILVTGDIFKPSDKRLKQNFAQVNPAAQLNTINQINIYDYDIVAGGNMKRERGVIAQEVAQVLPSAVHHIGNYQHGGEEVDNLLVVNERVLLMENIGATQYLDRVVQEEREELDYVNNKVEELEIEEKKKSSYVMKTIQNMGSLIMSEDFRESPRSEWIYCGFSICGLGPAWSVFVMGFFFTPAWFLGSLYVSSRNPIKRAAGIANILMLIVVAFMVVAMVLVPDQNTTVRALISAVIVVGVLFLAAVSYYKRKRERLRDKVLKHNLRQVIGRY